MKLQRVDSDNYPHPVGRHAEDRYAPRDCLCGAPARENSLRLDGPAVPQDFTVGQAHLDVDGWVELSFPEFRPRPEYGESVDDLRHLGALQDQGLSDFPRRIIFSASRIASPTASSTELDRGIPPSRMIPSDDSVTTGFSPQTARLLNKFPSPSRCAQAAIWMPAKPTVRKPSFSAMCLPFVRKASYSTPTGVSA